MDSLSQLALGAAVGVAVMGRRTAVWKAALWGGLCGTLPDLDVLIDHGDPVLDMTLHRGNSHALFWLTLAAAPIGWAIAALHRETAAWHRWVLAAWAALVTHPLLDAMTVYGTQLLRPFDDTPLGLGSIFIIDPLYTLPLLAGVITALRRRGPAGFRANLVGLVLSTAYLAWSALTQAHVETQARDALAAQGLRAEDMLVTPTPFNTVLWRIVVLDGDQYLEGFHGLLDGDGPIVFDRFPRGEPLQAEASEIASLQRLAKFSRGFFRVAERGGELRVADLRMGQEPSYVFDFALARRTAAGWQAVPPRDVGQRGDVGAALRWLGRRILGDRLPPPR